MSIEDFFRDIRAFRCLTQGEFESLCRNTRERIFEKGSTIFFEGQPSTNVWMVRTGWVHLIKRTASGNGMILFTMSPRELLCGVSAFDQEPYAAQGVAATSSNLLQIPSGIFVGFLNSNPQFCREILSISASRIRRMAQKLGEMGDPVSQRIARLLLASAGDFGSKIPFTHREIAQMIGTRVETSIRTLRTLREKDLISIRRSCIEIKHVPEFMEELKGWIGEKQAVAFSV